VSARSRLALAVLFAVLLPAVPGRGAEPASLPAGVIVLRPPAEDRVLHETSWRVRSELDVAGISSRMVDCPARTANGGCGGDDASVARISLSREEGIVTITVAATLPDGLELRRRVRVDPAQGGDEPTVIAVRAVELLRDIYLDIPRATRPSAPTPVVAPPPAAPLAPASPPLEPRLGRVFAGIGVLTGRKGLGPAAGPYAGVGLGLGRFAAVATIAGPFSERLGRVGQTRPEVDQSLLTLGLRYELDGWRVRPFATVATGLHYVRVQFVTSSGEDTDPTTSSLAPLLAVGAGVSVPLWKWLMFSTEMAVLVSNPSVDVWVRTELVGRAGVPSFLAQAGLAIAPQ
jgi:hypothetical protein